MKRSSTVALVAALTLVAFVPMARAQGESAHLIGFDYEDPDIDPSTIGEVGSGYAATGFVTSFTSPFQADLDENEYTYRLSGATSTQVVTFGSIVAVIYSGGTLTVYEDSRSAGTSADFGSPGSFTDGTVFLICDVSDLALGFDVASHAGAFELRFELVGGSQLVFIPTSLRAGYAIANLTEDLSGTPAGYAHVIDGGLFLGPFGDPARPSSWGRIKAAYR